jgi:hypothetical protein
MIPLLTSLVCANECDRTVVGAPPTAAALESALDFDAEEITLDLWVTNPSSPTPTMCDKCGSTNVGPFDVMGIPRTHCIPCGHVW